ncbi:MAG TPA: M15 family metallopeptidase [Terriglobales bacterium]|nr:M15 family metallopeptidase [Terriglobales bacterium]
MNLLRKFAIAAIVIGLATSSASPQLPPAPTCAQSPGITESGALRVPPKPPDAPARWKPLIGRYDGSGMVIHILERCGTLSASEDSVRYHRLDELSGDSFRSTPALMGNAEVRVTRDHARVTQLHVGNLTFQHTFGEDTFKSFRMAPLRPTEELRKEALAAQPPKETGKRAPDLVELIALDPTIKLEIRYATANNFMGTPFYTEARAFLQRPAAESLVRAHRNLKTYGYGLLIHDAYRPWYVTKMFWDATPADKKDFVADPAKGSNHNRGGAVDLSIYELATGLPVRMPGGYDEMSDRSHADYPGGSSLQRWHRDLLRAAMESEDFKVFKLEWWHFDHRDYKAYPVLNVPFSKISSSSKTVSNSSETNGR